MRKCSVSSTLQLKCLYCTWFIPKYCWASRREPKKVSAIAASSPRTTILILLPIPLVGCHDIGVAPKPFYLVKRSQRRVKDVNHEVHKIEKHPSALLNTFRMVNPYSLFFQLGDDMLANGPDVSIRGSTRNHEV